MEISLFKVLEHIFGCWEVWDILQQWEALRNTRECAPTHTHTPKTTSPWHISWFLGAFSLSLGMVLLTHEPSLMSLLVHLFFNIQHLTPSVVLKYNLPASPSFPTWFSSYAVPLHHPLILSALPRDSVFLDTQLVGRKCPIFCCIEYSILSFSPPSVWLSLSLMISSAFLSFIFQIGATICIIFLPL